MCIENSILLGKKSQNVQKCTFQNGKPPGGAARAERPQRGVRKGQTLAADLSAPLSAASLGGAGGLPNANTPLRTRTERPKAGLSLCAGGWARWAKRTQRTRSEQGKSKLRVSSEQWKSKGRAMEEQGKSKQRATIWEAPRGAARAERAQRGGAERADAGG